MKLFPYICIALVFTIGCRDKSDSQIRFENEAAASWAKYRKLMGSVDFVVYGHNNYQPFKVVLLGNRMIYYNTRDYQIDEVFAKIEGSYFWSQYQYNSKSWEKVAPDDSIERRINYLEQGIRYRLLQFRNSVGKTTFLDEAISTGVTTVSSVSNKIVGDKEFVEVELDGLESSIRVTLDPNRFWTVVSGEFVNEDAKVTHEFQVDEFDSLPVAVNEKLTVVRFSGPDSNKYNSRYFQKINPALEEEIVETSSLIFVEQAGKEFGARLYAEVKEVLNETGTVH